jgi:hypothetical protein
MPSVSNRRRVVAGSAAMPASRPSSVDTLAFVLMIAGAVLQQQQPAQAQALDLRDGTANNQPVVFDNKGGHHSCMYGYYGPPVPYFSDRNMDNMSNAFIMGTCQIK